MVVITGRKCTPLIADECMGKSDFFTVQGHVFEVAKSIGIGEWTVFPPTFPVIAALFVIGATTIAIGTRENFPFRINFHIKGIAPSFSINFKNMGIGVVTPYSLATEFHIFGRLRADIGGGRTSLGTINPAVGSPSEAIRYGMGVFQAEPG